MSKTDIENLMETIGLSLAKFKTSLETILKGQEEWNKDDELEIGNSML